MVEHIKEVKNNRGFGNMYQPLLFSKSTAGTDWESAFRQQEILNVRDINNFPLQENQLYKGKVGTKLDDIKNDQKDIRKSRQRS